MNMVRERVEGRGAHGMVLEKEKEEGLIEKCRHSLTLALIHPVTTIPLSTLTPTTTPTPTHFTQALQHGVIVHVLLVAEGAGLFGAGGEFFQGG